VTFQAGDVVVESNAFARFKSTHPRAHLDNGAGRLVAENTRWRQSSVLDFFDIGWANPAGRDLNQQLVGAYSRDRQLLEAQVVPASVHNCLHCPDIAFRHR
jgi:hypothetical protein